MNIDLQGQSTEVHDVRSHSHELKMVRTPFNFPYDDDLSDVQLELIELQASDVLLSKFTSSTTFIDFYCQLPHQVPKLLAHAKHVIAMFGTLFSKMNM